MESNIICSFCAHPNTHKAEPLVNSATELSTLRMQDVVAKHFWFTPMELKSFTICAECWHKLFTFHLFYCQVERLYQHEPEKEDSECDEKPRILQKLESVSNHDKADQEGDTFSIKSEANESIIEEEILVEFAIEKIDEAEVVKVEDSLESVHETDLELNDDKQHEPDESFSKKRVKDRDILIYCSMDCNVCPEQFENFNQLKQHYNMVHGQKGYATCCDLRFEELTRLREHIQVHLNPEIFRCSDCRKNFRSKRSLQCHQLLVHLPDEEKSFQCTVCTKKFAKQYQLNTHMVKHTEEKHFPCPHCQKPFATKGTLGFHIRNIHERVNAAMCDICSKILKSRSAFLMHRAEHFNTKRVQCPTCGAWMKNENTLRKHLVRHQEEAMDIVCNICGKKSPNSHALKKHIRDQHTSERSHQCTMCEKAFKRALALKEHMAIHTGQQLYTCAYCSKEFKSSANLCSHRKKAHPVEWQEYQQQKPTARSSD